MPLLDGWSAAAKAQLEGGSISPAIFARIETDPVMRLWSGIGEFVLPADLIETTDQALYLGLGVLVDLPELEAFLNGQAGRIEITLAGPAVTDQALYLASTNLEVTQMAEVNFGLLILGQDLQPISPVAWLWAGQASSLTLNRDHSGPQPTASITLSIGSLMTGRSRPSNERWTDASQKARAPGDRFFENIANYNAGTTKQWPTP